jgi:hypothetical protein
MEQEERKAEQLIEKYLRQPISFPYVDTQNGNCIGSGYMLYNSAVRCVILEVNEIVNAIDWHEFEVPNKEINKWLTVLEILRDKLR